MNRTRLLAVALASALVLSLVAFLPLLPSSAGTFVDRAEAQADSTSTPMLFSTAAPTGTSSFMDTATPTALATSAPSATPTPLPTAAPSPTVTATQVVSGTGSLSGFLELQSALQQLYKTAAPSVVNIQVTVSGGQDGQVIPRLPGRGTPSPFGQGRQPFSQALGSGFVWDSQGHIVTNNHVVDGASNIQVTMSSGATVTATLVGRDPDSDLAVIKVDPTGLSLKPVTMGDSTQAQVGEFVVAIGNPFGLQGTMTFGIISGLGRSLPVNANTQVTGQPSYTIPDIVQTDAPVNPGNSGGVLLDLQGHVIGVPSAIEGNALQPSSGTGFAIPSVIVSKIVPQLIQTGSAQHSYVGISGTTLSPAIAQAMNLPPSQLGALVIDVAQGGPAAKAGLQGSTRTISIDGQQVPVGGDVIVAVNGQPVTNFDDLTTFLVRSTNVGDTVRFTILRNGQQQTVSVTLGNRPASAPAAAATPEATEAPSATPAPFVTAAPTVTPPASTAEPATPPAAETPMVTAQPGGTAFLGVSAITLDSSIAQAMGLPSSQTGALVQSVVSGSPADQAGLQGSSRSAMVQGLQVMIGGDIITAFNNQTVNSADDLVSDVRGSQPGQQATLTVLRNGRQANVSVTLGSRP